MTDLFIHLVAYQLVTLSGTGVSVLEDGLPADVAAEALHGAAARAGGAAPPGRHGLPRGREEAVAGQQPDPPERPKQRRWNGVDDPISHCLAGNSLLLTGLPGTGKTHPDHCCEAARAGRGGAPGVQDALLRAEPGAGGAPSAWPRCAKISCSCPALTPTARPNSAHSGMPFERSATQQCSSAGPEPAIRTDRTHSADFLFPLKPAIQTRIADAHGSRSATRRPDRSPGPRI